MWLLFMLLIFSNVPVETKSEESLLDLIYWEVKPYIFTNKDGEMDGIIPKMLEEAQYYCMNRTGDVSILSNYAVKAESRKYFYNLIRSNFSYGHGIFENVTREKAFWVPVLENRNKKSKELEKQKRIKSFQLVKSTGMAVIVRRSLISLPTKLFRGIKSCQQIFILALILAVLLSMLIWLIEHSDNDSFPDSFISGIGTGLWWSFVSMTTVGYGDIIIKSVLGRFIAVMWLFISVMITCVITATITDVLSGMRGIDFRGQEISVLENSYEAKVAGEDYGVHVVPAPSYEAVIEMVRNEKVFGAMINVDVAAWHQNEIHNDSADTPLRVVEILPANLYVNCWMPMQVSDAVKDIFRCMYTQQDEVYKSAIENFQRNCHKEVLFIASVSDFFRYHTFIQVMAWAVFGMFLVGLAYETYRYDFKKLRKNYANNINDPCTKIILPHDV